ncbi:MAG: histidinol-phosphatase [Deltaproteobacteria bacterium]|nr:histidinol-phosphatase [Deltaproteobacteria bacterium]
MNDPMQPYVEFANRLAKESATLIMSHFGGRIVAERKADQTPVTLADREAEQLMRRLIEAQYPKHQVLGEEGGLSGPDNADFQWVLDPIDGTKSFMHGVPLFGTLIALLREGQPVLGVIHLPALGQLVLGCEGRTTTLNGQPVQVSEISELSEATVLYTCPVNMRKQGMAEKFKELEEKARLVRTWGDCYGHLLVATGQADVMYDPTLSLWDVAALKPCVEGAGGLLTDRDGSTAIAAGQAAVSTNGLLHQEVLDILGG